MWRYPRGMDAETMSLFLAHSRLESLVHAAASIEYHVRRIERLSRALLHSEIKRMGSGEVVFVTHEMARRASAAGRNVEAIDIEWHDVLWWGRTLIGRLSHEFGPRGNRQSVGLLAFLTHRESQDVRRAAQAFKSRWELELSALADYSLHFESISRSQPRFTLGPAGATVPIPNRVTARPIEAFTNFNFTEGRDALTFSRELLRDAGTLIDSILEVFAKAQAARWTDR